MTKQRRRRARKKPVWPDHPDDLPHERIRRALNRLWYRVDTKQFIADD
jgi:hypothetical protein